MNSEELIDLLRRNGYKVTPQRLAICQEVLSRNDHPTAEQIFETVSKEHPTISLTTIYHTLDLLKDMRLVDELHFDERTSRYDPNTSVHINVICNVCGKIRDYESDTIRKHWKKIISEIESEPVSQRLDVYVVCDNCE
ncbi:MAG: Fur family transcriptional regulator [Candidatus Thorarchaeota archaeon]